MYITAYFTIWNSSAVGHKSIFTMFGAGVTTSIYLAEWSGTELLIAQATPPTERKAGDKRNAWPAMDWKRKERNVSLLTYARPSTSEDHPTSEKHSHRKTHADRHTRKRRCPPYGHWRRAHERYCTVVHIGSTVDICSESSLLCSQQLNNAFSCRTGWHSSFPPPFHLLDLRFTRLKLLTNNCHRIFWEGKKTNSSQLVPCGHQQLELSYASCVAAPPVVELLDNKTDLKASQWPLRMEALLHPWTPQIFICRGLATEDETDSMTINHASRRLNL